MKLIFILVCMLISKIVVFVVQETHTWSYGNQCIHYVCLSDVAYEADASLDPISSEMSTAQSL